MVGLIQRFLNLGIDTRRGSWLDDGMTTTTVLNTTTITASELTDGDIVVSLGKVTFTEPALITQTKFYKGKLVWAVTANGGFWPMSIVGPNTPAVVAA